MDTPLALHVHLTAQGQSLAFSISFERYEDPTSLSRWQPSDNFVVPSHPGCVRRRPAFVPGSFREVFLAALFPRLGNHHPVPLPGHLRELDTSRAEFPKRTLGEGPYHIVGWAVPASQALTHLRPFLRAWTRRYGAALSSPGCFVALDALDLLHSAFSHGNLLPTRLPGLPDHAPARWIPPVSLHTLMSFRRALVGCPSLGAVHAWCVRAHEFRTQPLVPQNDTGPFARFAVEALSSVSGDSSDNAPTAKATPLKAEVLASLHASFGSCLHPNHDVWKPAVLPSQSHLHGVIAPSDQGRSEHPWQMEMALIGEGPAVPLFGLLKSDMLRDPVVEASDDTVRRFPASVAYRDWEGLLDQRPFLGARPELLRDGRSPLTEAEMSIVAGLAPMHGRPTEKVYRALGMEAPSRGREPVLFSVSIGNTQSARLRVKWSPVNDGELEQQLGEGGLAMLRFVPELTVVLGEDELSPEQARLLLASTEGAILRIGRRAVPRSDLEAVLELALARRKVLDRLMKGGSLGWQDVNQLEDEWTAARDAARLESVFAAQWEIFLEKLASGSASRLTETPPGFQGTLRPYQLRGLSWMDQITSFGLGACLADDMGLGKTVQVLALLWHHRRPGAPRRPKHPDLVVCPTSVVHNWVKEAKRFAPKLKVYMHQESSRETDPRRFGEVVRTADVMVTSYALLRRDRALFEEHRFNILIVDEAQHVKNPLAQQTQVLKGLRASRRLALTGTPVENHLRDLWSIYDLVMPGLLGGPTRFSRAFLEPLRRGEETAMARLRRRVGPFMLRRSKRDPEVAGDLPPRTEQIVECGLTREQAALYRALTEVTFEKVKGGTGMGRRASILAALTGLKQICNHPENYVEEDPERLLGRSSKLDRCMELLEELIDQGQPTLVFTQYREMGELLQAAIEQRFDREVPFFHGGLSPRDRENMLDAFRSEDGEPVLILSLKAGGTGLNLVRATAVIHYDRWWNPAVEDQATDRAHRIGQTRPVNVYKFVTTGTLEERIQRMLEEKRSLAAEVLSDAGETWVTEMSDRELRDFLKLEESSEDGAES